MQAMRRFTTVFAMVAMAATLCFAGVAQASAATVAMKASATAKATIYYNSGTQKSVTLKVPGKVKATAYKWKTSKPSIASVTKLGKVTAKKSGKVTVTAAKGKTSYKAAITVKAVSLNKTKATLKVGKTVALKLMGDTIKSVSTSDKSVATVAKNGKVTAKAAGKAIVTLTSKGGKKYACAITAKAVAPTPTPDPEPAPEPEPETVAVIGIAFTNTAIDMKVGDEPVSNPATVAPDNATNKSVTYTSSNTDIATVSAEGVITAVAPGEATITATSADDATKTAMCKVTVAAAPEPDPAPEPAPAPDPGLIDVPGGNQGDDNPPATVAVVRSVEALNNLLSGSEIPAKVTLQSNESGNLSIGSLGVAAQPNTSLVIDAPNATIDNYVEFNGVTIDAIAENTYCEHANNAIEFTAPNGRLVIEAPRSSVVVKSEAKAKVEVNAPDAEFKLENRGVVDDLVVANAKKVTIENSKELKRLSVGSEGTHADAKLDVELANNSGGTIGDLTIKANDSSVSVLGDSAQLSIPTKLEAKATVETSRALSIEALEGSEGSSLVLQPGSTGTKVTVGDESLIPATEGVGTVEARIVDEQGAVTEERVVTAEYSVKVAADMASNTEASKVSVIGWVFDSAGSPLEGAKVDLLRYTSVNSATESDAAEIGAIGAGNTTTTNEQGAYTFEDVAVGNYTIVVSSDGMVSASLVVTVQGDKETVNVKDLTLVKAQQDVRLTLAGKVIDSAQAGEVGIEEITVYLRTGADVQSGAALAKATTDGEGEYSFADVAPGMYTVQVVDLSGRDTPFLQTYKTITVVEPEEGAVVQVPAIGMSSTLAEDNVRFVLTWGDEDSGAPSDLDSHLIGPSMNGDNGGWFHTWYSNKAYSAYVGEDEEDDDIRVTMADLDRDDTTWEGPETTTIYHATPGTYTFFVHDFSNYGSTSTSAMSNSGAHVEVYSGDVRRAEFDITPNREGTLWAVCAYDSASNKITELGDMSYETSDGEDVGSEVMYGGLKITGLQENAYVTGSNVSRSTITAYVTAPMSDAHLADIVATYVPADATASLVAYDESREGYSITLTSADKMHTRTYSFDFRIDYGDFAVASLVPDDVVVRASVYNNDYSGGNSSIVVYASDPTFETCKDHIHPVLASGGVEGVDFTATVIPGSYDEDDDYYTNPTLVVTRMSDGLSRSYQLSFAKDYGDFRIVGLEDDDIVTFNDIEEDGDDSYLYVRSTSANPDVYLSKEHLKPEFAVVGDYEYAIERESGDPWDTRGLRLVAKDNANGQTRSYNLRVSRTWYEDEFEIANVSEGGVITKASVDSDDDEIYLTASATSVEALKAAFAPTFVDEGYACAFAVSSVNRERGYVYVYKASDGAEAARSRGYLVFIDYDYSDLEIIGFKENAVVTGANVRTYTDEAEGYITLTATTTTPSEYGAYLEPVFATDAVGRTWRFDTTYKYSPRIVVTSGDFKITYYIDIKFDNAGIEIDGLATARDAGYLVTDYSLDTYDNGYDSDTVIVYGPGSAYSSIIEQVVPMVNGAAIVRANDLDEVAAGSADEMRFFITGTDFDDSRLVVGKANRMRTYRLTFQLDYGLLNVDSFEKNGPVGAMLYRAFSYEHGWSIAFKTTTSNFDDYKNSIRPVFGSYSVDDGTVMELSWKVALGSDGLPRLYVSYGDLVRSYWLQPVRDYGDFRVDALEVNDVVVSQSVNDDGDDASISIAATSTKFADYKDYVKPVFPEGKACAYEVLGGYDDEGDYIEPKLVITDTETGEQRSYWLYVSLDWGDRLKVVSVEETGVITKAHVDPKRITLNVTTYDAAAIQADFNPTFSSDSYRYQLELGGGEYGDLYVSDANDEDGDERYYSVHLIGPGDDEEDALEVVELKTGDDTSGVIAYADVSSWSPRGLDGMIGVGGPGAAFADIATGIVPLVSLNSGSTIAATRVDSADKVVGFDEPRFFVAGTDFDDATLVVGWGEKKATYQLTFNMYYPYLNVSGLEVDEVVSGFQHTSSSMYEGASLYFSTTSEDFDVYKSHLKPTFDCKYDEEGNELSFTYEVKLGSDKQPRLYVSDGTLTRSYLLRPALDYGDFRVTGLEKNDVVSYVDEYGYGKDWTIRLLSTETAFANYKDYIRPEFAVEGDYAWSLETEYQVDGVRYGDCLVVKDNTTGMSRVYRLSVTESYGDWFKVVGIEKRGVITDAVVDELTITLNVSISRDDAEDGYAVWSDFVPLFSRDANGGQYAYRFDGRWTDGAELCVYRNDVDPFAGGAQRVYSVKINYRSDIAVASAATPLVAAAAI